MDEAGLYKKQDDYTLIFAANKIHFPDGTIIFVEEYNGKEWQEWKWFETRKEAEEYFNIKEPEL